MLSGIMSTPAEALTHTAESLSRVAENVSDLLHSLLGPAAQQYGLLLGEKVLVRRLEYRIGNLAKILGKVKQMHAEVGIEPRVIPPRVSIPAVDAASVEDDETVQERWAALLANAADPQFQANILPSFVEVLKQLTPEEARLLQHIYKVAEIEGVGEDAILIGNIAALSKCLTEAEDGTQPTGENRLALMSDDLIRLGIITVIGPQIRLDTG
jgi:Abortive infection alpha